MHNFIPYEARTIKFINQAASNGWRVKLYGISPKSSPLPNNIVSVGAKMVLPHLPQPAITEHRYGVGFLISHCVQPQSYVPIFARVSGTGGHMFSA